MRCANGIRVLGIDFFDWGGAWFPSEPFAAHAGSGTVVSPMKDAEYMAPSTREYMINFVVDGTSMACSSAARSMAWSR